jgi:cation-transporting ATPase 13A3/4/5
MGGLTTEQAATALGRFGPNLIEVPMPSLWNSIFNEFTKGFYTYQMFMAWTWLNFTYWHMGVINMLVFSLGGLIVAYNEHKNRVVLHKLVKDDSIATVIRNGQPIEVPAANLVPGDVIEVKEGSITVDCVMLQGSTVVDESSLTGESTPVFKTHVDTADRPPSSKACQLFAGTSVVDGGSTAEKALALVVKTGGNTDKGRQVAEILFRDAPIFKFDVQVIPVLGCLCVWAVFGFCLTLNFLGDEPVYSFFFGMYVVASALPPLLPTVFVVSVGIASERLRKRGVVCSDPQRLLVAGKVRVCCFDKTGTLTKNGMDFHGVRECKGDVISGQHSETIPAQSTLEYIMASCHTLSSITSSGGSMLVGTAVDKMMFGATGWSLVPSKTGSVVSNGTATLHEARRFNFDFVRQTSSVIVRNEQGKHMIFVKGSAEAIAKTLGSTPEDFAAVANSYARDGCYTLALAWRVATPNEEKALAAGQNVERGDAEFNLAFAGFLTFRNDLKEDSKQALEKLREGACRCIMLTGDHALTGVHIAREVGMLPTGSHVVRSVSIKDDKVQWVDEDDNSLKLPEGDEVEIVMLGAIWRELSEAEKTRLLPRVRIFARAAPDDKLAVVALIIKQGLVVSMCGDGGNDCGALRAAHVGVALSEAEASVVSPFTGIEKSCMSVVDVLLEGRASLASAIACYKYMLMYGVVETCNQMIQAYFAVTFSEWCWVFMDGFWVVSFSLSLALARPAAKLSPERPPSSLLGGYVLSSFLGTFFIHFIITIVALAVLNAQDFYQCRRWDTASADLSSVVVIGDNYESEVIFLVTGAQYITSAMTFNFGHKHRANWLNNYVFVFFAVLWLSIHFHITLVPSRLSCLFRVNCDSENIDGLSGLVTGPLAAPDATECGLSIQNFWGTTRMPEYFRPIIIGLILADMALCMAWEKLVLHGPPGRAVRAVYRAGHKNKLTELKI